MPRIEHLRNLMINEMQKQGISQLALAKKAGVDHGGLYRFFHEPIKEKITFNFIIKVMKALDIKYSVMDDM